MNNVRAFLERIDHAEARGEKIWKFFAMFGQKRIGELIAYNSIRFSVYFWSLKYLGKRIKACMSVSEDIDQSTGKVRVVRLISFMPDIPRC